MEPYRHFTLLLILSFLCMMLAGQKKDLASGSTNERVALIIGNSDYTSAPLLNPENDARAMAAALRDNGFVVFEHINMEYMADMKRAIREFGREIQNGGVGLFYYAGHGIQVSGRNYLIPTKAEIYAEEEVEYEAVDVGFALAQMEIAQNRMNIVILDACRNNPFARSWRSAGTGLAFINAPTGTLIAYATAPGSVASDGTGSNGLYTEEFLKQVGKQGLKIEDVFKQVRSGVIARSNNLQTPWESSSLVGDFYFKRPEKTIVETSGDEKIAEMLETGGMTTWHRSGEGYEFYQSGVEIANETSSCTIDDDALLYDPTTNRNYLLKDYWKINDEESREALELVSRSNAFWTRENDMNFRFYFEGSELTETMNNAWFKDELIIYVIDRNKYYLLRDFEQAEKNKLFKADPIYSSNYTLWWTDGVYFHLYVKGDQISSRTYWQWEGNDLIVYDTVGRSSYKLPGFYTHSDEIPRPATILVAPGEITWKKQEDNTYWLSRNGVDFESLDVNNDYCENDLLVYEKNTRQDFLLRDYLELEFDTAYPAEVLFSKDHAFWMKVEDGYYFFVNGQMISPRTSAEQVDNDLEINDSETGTVWLCKDYFIMDNNVIMPATVKE